jgi:hypothetical protein
MTRDEFIALIDQSSWRSLDLVIATLPEQPDDTGRRRIAAMGMAFVARRRARPSSLHRETDQLLEELSKAKSALDAAARGAKSVSDVTTRLLTVARRVIGDAAVSSVEWATTADVAEALMHEAARCADGDAP